MSVPVHPDSAFFCCFGASAPRKTNLMLLSDFDFDLPADLIASRPMVPREAARMLDLTGCAEALSPTEALAWHDRTVAELPDRLQPGDILVCNDTRVIPARLRGKRGAAKVEVTLHKQDETDLWRAFARPARKLAPGNRIDFAPDFFAMVEEKGEAGEVSLRFSCGGADLFLALEQHGEMPLPPYIKRDGGADEQDSKDYQTLFADKQGAVAAPTAGLHFTEALLEKLDAKGIRRVAVTLHVGAGTFLPVKVDNIAEHKMHSERGIVSAETAAVINEARAAGGRVVALGTTSLRLLESAAREDGTLQAWDGETDIFITPGYRFRAVDLLFTNFHLPCSTLFMLVCAFAGMERMKAAYAHAVAEHYRFFSYGDCCLLEPGAGAVAPSEPAPVTDSKTEPKTERDEA